MLGNERYSTSFLEKLYEHKIRKVYTKIELLDWEEKVLGRIDGIVLNGNYNVDGNSSVRRNVSLTLSIEDRDEKLVFEYLDLSKKIKLYAGLENFTNEHTDKDIIWFNLGTYVLLDPTYSHTVGELRMTIQAQDKMALLNGVIGGVLPTATSFNRRDSKTGKIHALSWREIFYYAATIFGEEDPARVVVDSVPDYIYDYTQVKTVKGLKKDFIHIKAPFDIVGERVITDAWHPTIPSREVKFSQSDRLYKLRRFGPPDPVMSDTSSEETYMKNAGEPVSSVFEDIKENLSYTHEYFYTTEGSLILQKLQNYVNDTFDPDKNPELGYMSYELDFDDYIPDFSGFPFVYDFSNKESVTSFSNNAAWTNVKNNFVAVGQEGRNTLQIAIDKKPTIKEIREWFIKFNDEYKDNPYSSDLEFLRLDGNPDRMPYDEEYDSIPYLYKEATQKNRATYVDLPLNKIPWQIALGVKNYMIRNIYSKIGQERVLPRWGIECESMIFRWTKNAVGDDLVPNLGIYNPVGVANSAPWLAGYKTLKAAEDVDEVESLDFGSPIFTSKGDPSFWSYFLDIIDEDTPLGKFSIDRIGKRTVVETSENATTMFRVMPKSLVVMTRGEMMELGGPDLLADMRSRGQAYAIIEDNTEHMYLRPEYKNEETKNLFPYSYISGNPEEGEKQYFAFPGLNYSFPVGGKYTGSFESNINKYGEKSLGSIGMTAGFFVHPETREEFELYAPGVVNKGTVLYELETPISEGDGEDSGVFVMFGKELEERLIRPATNMKYFVAIKLDMELGWVYSRVSELLVDDVEKHKELKEEAQKLIDEQNEWLKEEEAKHKEEEAKRKKKYDEDRAAALKEWLKDKNNKEKDFKYPDFEPKPWQKPPIQVLPKPEDIPMPQKMDRKIIWSRFNPDSFKYGDIIVAAAVQDIFTIEKPPEEVEEGEKPEEKEPESPDEPETPPKETKKDESKEEEEDDYEVPIPEPAPPPEVGGGTETEVEEPEEPEEEFPPGPTIEIAGSGQIDYFAPLMNMEDGNLVEIFHSDGAIDCFSKARDLIYRHTNYSEVITINTLPIYHLEPNTLIRVEDERTGIRGVFMITSFSIPFSPSGSDIMTINAVKVNQRI